MRKLHYILLKYLAYQSFIKLLQRVKVPFFENVPLYDIIKFFLLEIEKGDITIKASSISFNIILALFPAIIFLFTMIPFIPVANLSDNILLFFEDIMPSAAFDTVRETIQDVALNKRGGLLSIGFILALVFSSNGVVSMMNSFNKTNEFFDDRSFFKQRGVAMLLTAILAVVFLVSISLMIGGTYLIDYLEQSLGLFNSEFYTFLIWISKWLLTVALIFIGIAFLFYYGPAKEERFRFFSPGAILATILLVLTSLLFSYYVENFAQYNKLYGSIGTLVVIMLWIYFNSLMLLIGYELDASIYVNKKQWLQRKFLRDSASEIA